MLTNVLLLNALNFLPLIRDRASSKETAKTHHNSDVLIVTHVRRRKDAPNMLPNAPAVDFPQNVWTVDWHVYS